MDEVEELRQENYKLKSKLATALNQENWYNDEIAQLQTSKKQDSEMQEALKEEVLRLQRKIQNLNEELDHQKTTEKNLRSQMQSLESVMEKNKTLNETLLSNSLISEDNTQLLAELGTLQKDNTQLKSDVIELQHELQTVTEELETLKHKLHSKDEEIEGLQCQITTYVNSIEKCKEENMELNAQIDILQIESRSESSKGNSLFSEVEDRRVKAEKLVKKYQLSNQQLNQQIHKLKMQMFSYMGLGKGKSDDGRVEELQNQIYQLQADKKQLLEQIHNTKNTEVKQNEKLGEIEPVEGEKNTGEHYVKYLLGIINANREEIAKLNNEIKVQKMLLLAEKDTVLSLERKQYESESQREKIRVLYLKEKMKVEDLRAKYEPEQLKNGGAAKKGKLEKLPVSENAIREVRQEPRKREITTSVTESQKESNSVVEHENVDPDVSRLEEMENGSPLIKKPKSVSLSDEIKMVDSEGGIQTSSLSLKEELDTVRMVQDKPVKNKGKRVPNIVKVEIPESKVNECSPQ